MSGRWRASSAGRRTGNVAGRVNWLKSKSGDAQSDGARAGVDALEHVNEAQSLVRGEVCEKFRARFIRDLPDLIEDRARLVFDEEAAGTPVVGIRAALDPSFGFHVVEYAHHAHGVDFGKLGEADLAHAFIS